MKKLFYALLAVLALQVGMLKGLPAEQTQEIFNGENGNLIDTWSIKQAGIARNIQVVTATKSGSDGLQHPVDYSDGPEKFASNTPYDSSVGSYALINQIPYKIDYTLTSSTPIGYTRKLIDGVNGKGINGSTIKKYIETDKQAGFQGDLIRQLKNTTLSGAYQNKGSNKSKIANVYKVNGDALKGIDSQMCKCYLYTPIYGKQIEFDEYHDGLSTILTAPDGGLDKTLLKSINIDDSNSLIDSSKLLIKYDNFNNKVHIYSQESKEQLALFNYVVSTEAQDNSKTKFFLGSYVDGKNTYYVYTSGNNNDIYLNDLAQRIASLANKSLSTNKTGLSPIFLKQLDLYHPVEDWSAINNKYGTIYNVQILGSDNDERTYADGPSCTAKIQPDNNSMQSFAVDSSKSKYRIAFSSENGEMLKNGRIIGYTKTSVWGQDRNGVNIGTIEKYLRSDKKGPFDRDARAALIGGNYHLTGMYENSDDTRITYVVKVKGVVETIRWPGTNIQHFCTFSLFTPVYGVSITDEDYNDSISIELTPPSADILTTHDRTTSINDDSLIKYDKINKTVSIHSRSLRKQAIDAYKSRRNLGEEYSVLSGKKYQFCDSITETVTDPLHNDDKKTFVGFYIDPTSSTRYNVHAPNVRQELPEFAVTI